MRNSPGWARAANSDFAKIASHQFGGPGRLAYFAARRETFEIRFYIEHGGAVHRVEFVNTNLQAGDAFDFANGDTDAIGTVFRTLREDAHLRPVGSTARMAGAGFDFLGRDAIQQEDYFDVRILVEAERA